jgi:hypothetical protein
MDKAAEEECWQVCPHNSSNTAYLNDSNSGVADEDEVVRIKFLSHPRAGKFS